MNIGASRYSLTTIPLFEWGRMDQTSNRVSASRADALSVRYPGTIALWFLCTVIGCLSYTRYYLQFPEAASKTFFLGILIWLTCSYPWILLAQLVFRLEQRFPLSLSKKAWKNVAVLAVAGIPFAAAALTITTLLNFFLPEAQLAVVETHEKDFLVELFFYAAAVGGGYFARKMAYARQREHERDMLALEKAQLETSLRDAELEVLRMRLNPHFLFNTLQNISVLVRDDPATANKMLVQLGDLLRAAFRREYSPEIALDAELKLTAAYLEIERLRFGDRLRISVSTDPSLENALVPTFLLQPLVENAVKHGLRGVAATGNILIHASRDGDQLNIIVRDDGVGIGSASTKTESGVGLSSTRERLQRLYPDQHTLDVATPPDGGTEIRIHLPLRWQPAEVELQSA
jgi:two-component system, LytTR family, sensor kinase